MFKDKGSEDLDADFYTKRGLKIDSTEVPLLQDATRILKTLKSKTTWEIQMEELDTQLRKTQIHLEDLRDEIIPQKDIKIHDLLWKIRSLKDSYRNAENKLNEQIHINSEKTMKINELESNFKIIVNLEKHDVEIMTDPEYFQENPKK